MKCPNCGKADLVTRRVPFTQGALYLGDFDAEVCPACGEILFTEGASGEINHRATELGLWGKEVRATTLPSAEFPVDADLIEVPSPGFFGSLARTLEPPPEYRVVIVKAQPESTSGERRSLKALTVHPRAQTA